MKAENQKLISEEVDRYLAGLPDAIRGALTRLRNIIRKAAPTAVEVISYQMPAYKQKGMLVGFAAYRKHCSFFVMSTTVMKVFSNDLKEFDFTKSAIHFTPDKPLPAVLIQRLVKARIRENEAHAARKEPRQSKGDGRAG